MEAMGGQARDLGTRRNADRVHHRRAFRADSSQDHAGSAEAHDRVAGSAMFTLKKDRSEFEDGIFYTLRRTSVG